MQTTLRLTILLIGLNGFVNVPLTYLSLSDVFSAHAATLKPPRTKKTLVVQYNPPKPPDLGAPRGRLRGGASRGGCRQYQALQPLMPNLPAPSAWGLTTAAHPTFWFYLPSRTAANIPMEFVLQTPTDEYVYKTLLTLQDTAAGIISIDLPTSVPALTPGVSYSWTLSMGCDANPNAALTFVKGYIQRQLPTQSFASTLLTFSGAEQKANLYAQEGFWYDAVTELARARQRQPMNAQVLAGWQDLLTQGGLTDLQGSAFATCCDRTSATGINATRVQQKD